MKKKSLRKPAENFIAECDKIIDFVDAASDGQNVSEVHKSWVYDYAIIRLYREFEQMLLECMVAGLNQDNTHLSEAKRLNLPKHLTDELCEYLIRGDQFFDFKGRKDIRNKFRKFLGDEHFLVHMFASNAYDADLRKLIALRHFAAHDSAQAKENALRACGLRRMGSSGSYLKKQGRLESLVANLKVMAGDIAQNAPY